MKSRRDAVELINMQLQVDSVDKWHYGAVQLRELMDFIYESKPIDSDEQIISNMVGDHINAKLSRFMP